MPLSCLKLFSNFSLTLEKCRNSISWTTKFFKTWYLLISLFSSLPTLPRLFPVYLFEHIPSCLWSLACGYPLCLALFSPTFLYLAPSSKLSLKTCLDSSNASWVSFPSVSTAAHVYTVRILICHSLLLVVFHPMRVGAGYILPTTVPQQPNEMFGILQALDRWVMSMD